MSPFAAWKLVLYTFCACVVILGALVVGEIVGLVLVALAFHLQIRIT